MKDYYKSKKILSTKIIFGFFTRNGGVSSNNFNSLNCSQGSGDNINNVKKNIKRALKKIKLNKTNIKIINQIHSNKVILINKYNFNKKYKADGMITKDRNISLATLTADCCPIFLFDNDTSFISNLHAGWKGCYNNIIKNALDEIKKIQPNSNSIKAIIGPCLKQKNFEVSIDFKKKFLKKNINYKVFFKNNHKTKKILFDMKGLIKFQLIKNKINHIENINLDTYSNTKLFYSHRRSKHFNELPTGRMINIIGFSK